MEFFTQAPSLSDLKAFSPLTGPQKRHLEDVYVNLATMFAISAAGSWMHMSHILNGSNGLFMLVGIASLLGFVFTSLENPTMRRGLLYTFAAMKGLTLGPLLVHATKMSPMGESVITMALGATALVFVSFTVAALYADKRSTFYLGGVLASSMSILFWMSFANLFLGWSILYNFELYAGLFMFSLFIVYDTQLILYKHSRGSRDALGHSLELYVDVVQVFVRILVILSRKDSDEDKRKKRKN